MGTRHVFTCGITKKTIDIRKSDTVMIAGQNEDGNKFVVYVRMRIFFDRFVNHENVPNPLPGLRPYRSKKFPHIRFLFDPSRFGASIQSWGPCKVFTDLLK